MTIGRALVYLSGVRVLLHLLASRGDALALWGAVRDLWASLRLGLGRLWLP